MTDKNINNQDGIFSLNPDRGKEKPPIPDKRKKNKPKTK